MCCCQYVILRDGMSNTSPAACFTTARDTSTVQQFGLLGRRTSVRTWRLQQLYVTLTAEISNDKNSRYVMGQDATRVLTLGIRYRSADPARSGDAFRNYTAYYTAVSRSWHERIRDAGIYDCRSSPAKKRLQCFPTPFSVPISIPKTCTIYYFSGLAVL